MKFKMGDLSTVLYDTNAMKNYPLKISQLKFWEETFVVKRNMIALVVNAPPDDPTMVQCLFTNGLGWIPAGALSKIDDWVGVGCHLSGSVT